MPRRATPTRRSSAAKGKRYPLNMRTTFEIRRALELSARASGRSLAQEAEIRIEQSISAQQSLTAGLAAAWGPRNAGVTILIGRLLAGADAAARTHGLDGWLESPGVHDLVVRAINSYLRAVRPQRPSDPAQQLRSFGHLSPWKILSDGPSEGDPLVDLLGEYLLRRLRADKSLHGSLDAEESR